MAYFSYVSYNENSTRKYIHIVQMLNRAVNSMCTDLMDRFNHSSKNYKLFKRNWKFFIKRYDDLNCTHQFYGRSQYKYVTFEKLVNLGLELADQ
ncbi:MAG: transposase [Lactobacillus sp.]|nr:transposase [Lactobacillus sp.]